MVSVVISFSRITILSFVFVFTVIDLFQLFEFKFSEALSSVLSTIQAVMVTLFLINTSIILYIVKQDSKIMGLLLLQLILFLFINVFLNKLTEPASKALIYNLFFFLSLSFVTLERLNLNSGIKQFVFTIVAAAIAFLLILLLRNLWKIQRFMFVFAAIGLILLIIVFFAGSVEYGAKLSLSIAGIRVQPSEFVKILYLFFISGCIVTYKDFRGFLFASVGAALHVVVLVLSRDLGTALIFLMTYLLLIFIAYKNYLVLSLELSVALLGGIFAYNKFPHIQSRFIAWTDPLSVVDDKGYQISQSLFAIGTGGWFGSGFTNGMPTKIPVVANDFIFAAISEEFGAIVAICVIICFMCFSVMLFNVAFNCTDSFYMLVVNGIGIIFSVQSILNIGGVIKFIPSTGVTLPFVSAGGSSLLSMFISFFIVECCNDMIYLGRD